MKMPQKKYTQTEVDLKQLYEELCDFKNEVIRFMKSYKEESERISQRVTELEKIRDIDRIWERIKSVAIAVLMAVSGSMGTYIFLR